MAHASQPPLSHTSSGLARGGQYFADSTAAQELAERIFNQAPDGFCEWKPLNNSFVFSPSCAHLLGYDQGQLPLNVASIAAHIYSEDYAAVKLFLAQSMLSGCGGAIKLRMIKQDASVAWFQLQLRVVESDDNDQIESAIFCISEIDQIAKSLTETKTQADNEAWLRSTIRQLLQSQDDNALDNCLAEFCRYVGIDHAVLRQVYREGERYRLIAKGWHSRHSGPLDFSRIIARKDMPYEFTQAEEGSSVIIDDVTQLTRLTPLFKQRLEELNIRAIATLPIFYQGHLDYYLSLFMTTGSQAWQQSTVSLGEALGDAMAQVAERRRITQTLELSEERFQHALEATQDGIWDWDLSQDNFYVTTSFLYMLGYDEEYLPLDREKISALLTAPTTLEDMFVDAGNGRGFIDRLVQFRHRQGHTVSVWVRAKHVAWDEQGNAIRAVGVNVDISRLQAHVETEPSSTDNALHTENPISANQNNSIPAPPMSVDEALNHAKILLAEDNPINQQVATGILKRKGVDVTIVSNGQEAIDLLQSSPPQCFDLVLMDLDMPVLDGYAATRLLRNHQAFKDLPIIALTAHAREEDRQNCLNIGMNDHVAKPVKPATLYAAIAKQLEHHHSSARH